MLFGARNQVGNEPVAVLLADDLILGTPALQEMVDAYQDGNMVAVMEVSPERPVPMASSHLTMKMVP